MSAYNEEFKKNGYSDVLDHASLNQTPAYQRDRMSHENIANSRNKSIIGVAVLPIIDKKEQPKRSKAKRINISLKSYQARLAVTAVLSSTIALTGLGLGKKAVQHYKDLSVVTTYNRAFDDEVIKPEKHPTKDHMGYYYDYSDIAQKVMSYDNIDEAVYLLVFDIGEYQADEVIRCTPYKSMESFIKTRGYDDMDDFRNRARQMILLDDEIKKKQGQLSEMRSEHTSYEFEPSASNKMNDMFTDSYSYNPDDIPTYSGGVK